MDPGKKALTAQIDWEDFKSELMLRFGTTPYEDRFGELCKLKQISTVRDYQSLFKKLLGKVGMLMDKLETTYFISGFREPLRADVLAQNPTTLSLAIFLA